MTQQEIKKQVKLALMRFTDSIKGLSETRNDIEQIISNSMKSESIAFGEWLGKNRIYPHSSLKGIWVKANIEYYTSELYEIFKNENQEK